MAYSSFNKATGVPGKMKPTMWAKQLLEVQEAELVAAQMMDDSHSSVVNLGGDAIVYNDKPNFNAQAYIVDSPITYQTTTENSKMMYLDQIYYSAFRLDYVDQNQALIDPKGVNAERCSRALMEVKDRAMLDIAADSSAAVNTFGSALNPIQITSENVLDFMRALLLRLDETNAKMVSKKGSKPNIVVPPSISSLMGKHCEKRQTKMGDDVIQGLDYKVYNEEINIYKTTNLSMRTNSTTNKASHKIFGGYKEAFAHATQIQITDKDVKLIDYMADAGRFLVLFGQTNLYPTATFSAFITT